MMTGRLILYHYVSGLVMMLANIIHNPNQEVAGSDMELVGPLLRLLDLLADNAKTEDINRIRKFCMELERRATIALGKVHINGVSSSNRKRNFDSMTNHDLAPDKLVLGWLDSNAETTSLVEAPRALDLAPVSLCLCSRLTAFVIASTHCHRQKV